MSNPNYILSTVHGHAVVATILEERMRDYQRIEQIKEELLSVFGTEACKHAIIDLCRVRFVGSVGFLAFLAVRRLAGVENVVLCNLDESIRELFLICRLISDTEHTQAPFQVCEDIETALALCGSM